MPLPILQSPGSADLVRLFHKTELNWARHLGEEAALDVGTAISNPELSNVWDANRVLDAALPEDGSVAEAVEEVEAHFRQAGTRCAMWLLNPAAPAERTAPLATHLTRTGWRHHAADILYLAGRPTNPVSEVGGLTVIPARASYRHARALAEESAAGWGQPQLADAALAHLDDPHFDALLALKDGAAAGTAGVLAAGEIGRIDQVFVSQPFRRRGVGRTLMSRVLEVCARSLFKHVMLSVRPDNEPAQALYRELGFRKVGEIVSYRRGE
jgi:ribosomal protein S18 acetylase RimI-like enzyme